MTTTIVQKVVARCRENFTTTSATAALITGTQRLLTVTAGNYVDIVGTVSAAIGAAADSFLNIYVDGAIAGEAGACSIGTPLSSSIIASISVVLNPIDSVGSFA